jgi:hypothetical protein
VGSSPRNVVTTGGKSRVVVTGTARGSLAPEPFAAPPRIVATPPDTAFRWKSYRPPRLSFDRAARGGPAPSPGPVNSAALSVVSTGVFWVGATPRTGATARRRIPVRQRGIVLDMTCSSCPEGRRRRRSGPAHRQYPERQRNSNRRWPPGPGTPRPCRCLVPVPADHGGSGRCIMNMC